MKLALFRHFGGVTHGKKPPEAPAQGTCCPQVCNTGNWTPGGETRETQTSG